MATCNYSTLADLDSLDGLSSAALGIRLGECPAICNVLLGEGNPDLFGIGVSQLIPSRASTRSC